MNKGIRFPITGWIFFELRICRFMTGNKGFRLFLARRQHGSRDHIELRDPFLGSMEEIQAITRFDR